MIAAPLVRPCCCRLLKVPRTSAFGYERTFRNLVIYVCFAPESGNSGSASVSEPDTFTGYLDGVAVDDAGLAGYVRKGWEC